jgi:hypothetical protein
VSYLLHPSGSLAYHLRAWRWRQRLWAPFHAEVGRWLVDWQPTSKCLVLVGPSAGYALNARFLERFERIKVLEPDPLARWLLRRRFPKVAFAWRACGDLAQDDGFERLAAAHPGAALLFCNLLGQPLHGQPAEFQRGAWLARLEPALRGRDWASWHDLISTHRAPDETSALELHQAEPLEALTRHWWRGGELEIVDHETTGLCPDRPRRHAIWQLAPKSWHLIEWLAT